MVSLCYIIVAVKKTAFASRMTQVFVLAGLLALIVLPRFLAGWSDLAAARRLAAGGQYAESAAAYRSAAERLPWRPDLYEQAGLASLQDGDYAGALDGFQQAEDRGALSTAGALARGDALFAMGETGQAVAVWEELAGDGYALHSRLAGGYEALHDYPAAIQAWRAYLDRHEDAAAHYRLGLLLAAVDPQQALPELMLAAGLEADLDPNVQVLRTNLNAAFLEEEPAYWFVLSGRGLLAIGELNLAQAAFEHAAALRPDYAEAWAWWAESRQQAGQNGDQQIMRALVLDPSSPLVQALAGTYFQRQGQPERALLAFQQAAAADPQNPAWQAALGGAYEAAGDLVQAQAAYRAATSLAPREPSYWRSLAEFCLRNGMAIQEDAIPAVARLLDLAPDDWRSYDIAGQVAFEVGALSQAETHLRKAAEMAPGQAAPCLHLGLVALLRGETSAARDYLARAAALDPGGPNGWRAERLLQQYFP